MQQFEEKLTAIADSLKKGVAPQKESVRSFLLWFNAERRGYRVVRQIRHALRRHGLTTKPDFEWAYIDGFIGFEKAPAEAAGNAISDDSAPDPTYRIGLLPSANKKPVYVAPNAPLQEIVTQMMVNSFSQLPVMTGPRDLEGAKVPGDDRKIETPADLTFGEYIRLMQPEGNWKKLNVAIDKAIFISNLTKVKDIRNDVMHFDPDGLDEDDLKFLREFAEFLKKLRDIGAF